MQPMMWLDSGSSIGEGQFPASQPPSVDQPDLLAEDAGDADLLGIAHRDLIVERKVETPKAVLPISIKSPGATLHAVARPGHMHW